MKRFNVEAIRHIAAGLYDHDDKPDIFDRLKIIHERFTSEYDYPANKVRKPILTHRVSEWLSGLALNIEFRNAGILELRGLWGESFPDEYAEERAISSWFHDLAQALVKFWAAMGVQVRYYEGRE